MELIVHKISLCGRRSSNEDVLKCILNLSAQGRPIDRHFAPIDLFIIADGHGGREVSHFVVPLLVENFMNPNNDYPLTRSRIEKIFLDVQEKLCQHPQKIAEHCGSTALLVVRYHRGHHYYIQVVNLGDSRALVCRKGLAIPLNKDHRPNWPDERRRIRELHGRIQFLSGDWRIGELSVSRSFGDLDNTPYISCIPDIYNYRLDHHDEFIMMGCDGVFDVLQNHDVANFINNNLYRQTDIYPIDTSHRNIARRLGEYCLKMGAGDNLSIIIIFLLHLDR
jgi:serine/threonine protein phosphatase PrpC